MSLISIDRTKCTDCGICKLRCPSCFTTIDNQIAVRDDGKRCIRCGHCIALCPADAVVHESLPATNFVPSTLLHNISAASFEQLVKRRRSHRHFQEKPVPDEILTRILNTCKHCPTGVNAQEVQVNVLRTPQRIRAASKLAVDHFMISIDRLEKEIALLEAENESIPEQLQAQYTRNSRYRRMGASFEKGFDPIFHKAPAVLIFHAPVSAPTPKDDCIIAAHTAVLHAELLGLGTCYIGLFNRAATESPAILEAMGLPRENQVFSTLILGYPALKFLKIPPRKPLSTRWE